MLYIKAVCIYFVVHNDGSFIIYAIKFCLDADKQDRIRNDEFRRKSYETGKLPLSRNDQCQVC